MNYFKNVYRGRHILLSLVKQDLKNRYRNSFIGVGWSLLTPLGIVLIIGVVFSNVLNQPIKEFIPYLFSGLIPWLFIVSSAEGGTGAFLSAEGYIKQTQTPIEIFPIRVALVAFVNMFYALIAFIIVFYFLQPEKFGVEMFLTFFSMFLFLVFGASLATIFAVINTYFRDFGPIQSLFFQGLFYATPIMFPAELLNKPNIEWIYKFNPFYYLMEIMRRPMLGDPIPDLLTWVYAIGSVLFVLICALVMISRIGRKITFKL